MASKEQIISLAESGMTNSAIANRCGVSDAYVSQILNESSLKKRILEAQLAVLDERTQRDAKYDSLEDALLDKMRAVVPNLYKPQDISRALIAINKAERRGASSQQLAELANSRESTVITLELPERVRTRVIKSHTKEVVSVDGRAMITKDSRLLLEESESSLSDSFTNDPLLMPDDGEDFIDPGKYEPLKISNSN